MINSVNAKFKHYINESGKGGATVGWYHEGEILYIACSICSERDTFSKKEGRGLVISRLNEEYNDVTSPFSTTATLMNVRDYLKGNIDNAFPVISFNMATNIINNLQFSDLKYDLLAKISTDICFS